MDCICLFLVIIWCVFLDTLVPMIHLETGARVSGDKAPKLRNLDQWMDAHRNWTVDVMTLAGGTPPTGILKNF